MVAAVKPIWRMQEMAVLTRAFVRRLLVGLAVRTSIFVAMSCAQGATHPGPGVDDNAYLAAQAISRQSMPGPTSPENKCAIRRQGFGSADLSPRQGRARSGRSRMGK
jgi:hypothetical protein